MTEPSRRRAGAFVVEPHPVNQPTVGLEPKQAGFIVAGLWAGCNRTNFDKAKTEAAQFRNPLAVFIETGRQTNRIGKVKPKDGALQAGVFVGVEPTQQGGNPRNTMSHLQGRHSEIMNRFGVETKQNGENNALIHDRKCTGRMAHPFNKLFRAFPLI